MDGNGNVYTYHTFKPCIENDYYTNGNYCDILFPIPLKRLQIAEITINEDGTWTYEIERIEGWYTATGSSGMKKLVLYKGGDYYYGNGEIADFKLLKISYTRIPDECII